MKELKKIVMTAFPCFLFRFRASTPQSCSAFSLMPRSRLLGEWLRLWGMPLLFAAGVLLTGCAAAGSPPVDTVKQHALGGSAASDGSADNGDDSQDDTSSAEFDHVLGLTKEQRVEDYNYLVKTLTDSYLCMGVRDRENPDDLSKDIFKEYLQMIEESDSDSDFYDAIYSTFYRLGDYGHLHLYEPEEYDMVKDLYDSDPEGREHWQEVLDSEVSQSCYKNIRKMLDSYDEDENGENEAERGESEKITAFMMNKDTAYVKINDFFIADNKTYQSDRKKLFSFYNKLGSCKDFIIDITDNGGGSEEYWQNLLVAPFIEKALSCRNYALLADSENNRPYIENVFESGELIPVSKLPDLPKLNRDGLEQAAYFEESTLKVKPGKYHAPFHGRIWLLVSENVYSASESFTVFCKATGFATIVGKRTGGDGIGALDPVFLQLPNSGLIAQFTMMFGLNPDGSSNEEKGTVPDIPSKGTEIPLVTVLRKISGN